MSYLSINFKVKNQFESDHILAILSNYNFEGFEELPNQLIVNVLYDKFDEESINSVLTQYPEIEFSKTKIEQQNWNSSWETSFEPVIIDKFVAIRADFHKPIQSVAHDIIITPKMSFGTGHHATTYLVISLMESINFVDKNVLDFGTGTGILAIIAEKLGATNILAIDNDEWSIKNAEENITKNLCSNITLSLASEIPKQYFADILLINVTFNVIKDNINSIIACLDLKSLVIFSGLLDSDEESIVELLAQNQLTIRRSLKKNGWIALEVGIAFS